MNIERLKIVRDNIANHPESDFTMASFIEINGGVHVPGLWDMTYDQAVQVAKAKDCGTACCVAGRTTAIFAPNTTAARVNRVARGLLDLTEDQGDRLFLGEFAPDELRRIERDQAVRVLDNVLATNGEEIRWGVVPELAWVDTQLDEFDCLNEDEDEDDLEDDE